MTQNVGHLVHVEGRTIVIAALLAVISVVVFAAEPVPAGDGVRTVYLIRHGEYDHDDERDPDVGHLPPNLTTRTAPGMPKDLAVPKVTVDAEPDGS